MPHSKCARAPRTGERCELNFGERPFAHPLPGFRPLLDPPAGRAAAEWLLACLRRLVLLLLGRGEGLAAARAQVMAHYQHEPKRSRLRPHALHASRTTVCLWYWTCEDAGDNRQGCKVVGFCTSTCLKALFWLFVMGVLGRCWTRRAWLRGWRSWRCASQALPKAGNPSPDREARGRCWTMRAWPHGWLRRWRRA